jgi:hypothetical protein
MIRYVNYKLIWEIYLISKLHINRGKISKLRTLKFQRRIKTSNNHSTFRLSESKRETLIFRTKRGCWRRRILWECSRWGTWSFSLGQIGRKCSCLIWWTKKWKKQSCRMNKKKKKRRRKEYNLRRLKIGGSNHVNIIWIILYIQSLTKKPFCSTRITGILSWLRCQPTQTEKNEVKNSS